MREREGLISLRDRHTATLCAMAVGVKRAPFSPAWRCGGLAVCTRNRFPELGGGARMTVLTRFPSPSASLCAVCGSQPRLRFINPLSIVPEVAD